MRVVRPLLLLLASLLLVGLTACTGGSEESEDEGPTAEEVMATARQTFEETSGLRLVMSTDDLPEDVPGVLSAEGVGTSAPAFDGDLTVSLSGQSVTVPVVAVDGIVHAQLPFTNSFAKVDPAAYGAPDPAALLDPDTGFPSLLTATEGLEEGESVRGGADNAELLTEYTGTVAAADMRRLLPSVSGGSFDVAWQVSDSGELRQAVMTGAFYPGSGPMTYTVDFSDYGTEQEITRP